MKTVIALTLYLVFVVASIVIMKRMKIITGPRLKGKTLIKPTILTLLSIAVSMLVSTGCIKENLPAYIVLAMLIFNICLVTYSENGYNNAP